MRIAVVQAAVDPASRTVTLQRALRAIDLAAEQDPAPDLILLPAFNDVLAVMSGNAEIIERPAGQTVAACGLRARQWGVFVAMGFAERGGDKPYVTGVLLDRDGDLCLANRQRLFRSCKGGCFASGGDVLAVDVLLGRIAVMMGDDLLDNEAWDAVRQANAGLVLGMACWGCGPGEEPIDGEAIRRQVSEQAGRCGICCAVADVTAVAEKRALRCPGASVIVDAGGQVVAAAEAGGPSTLWGNLALPQVRPAVREQR
ncbi:MAG: carbon-nitrogen hydrolase family protein [Phycisphaerae bacterium]|nr:carbon-nitrogen hydrolase family protein [Phycisphaerae bacterium]